MSPQTSGAAETREFQAETRQLLDLMIHSIYSNPDTFLREVISNSSDALDKLRLVALQDSTLGVDTSALHIELVPDEQARTLTIRDNGIGMSRDEVVDLIAAPNNELVVVETYLEPNFQLSMGEALSLIHI